MSEGSILRTTIAGILGLIIVRNSIDEQIPTCILATPPKAIATASCPAREQLVHDHREEKALPPTALVAQLTGVSSASSSFSGVLTNATPILAAAADCPAKDQAPLHLERKDEAPTEEMPLPLRNAAANFLASDYVPRRREFIQPDQYNNLIVHMQPSCPEKDQAPLHLERKDEFALPVDTNITPNAGSLAFNDEAVNILMNPPDDGDDDGTELAYNSGPCPDKDQAPLHLERKDVDTLASDAPPPSPTFNMIQQIMASFQDPAGHQILQPIQQSAAHL
jgi:hypothetical protein